MTEMIQVSGEDTLADIRSEIRQLTEEILHVIAKRVKLSQKIGYIKKNEGLPIEDISVERNLRKLVQEKSVHLGMNPKLGLRLMNLIVAESKSVQLNVIKNEAITPSIMLQKAMEMENKGEEIIHLEAGEPDFPPASKILNATKEALNKGQTNYVDPVGIEPLREAIASHLNKKYHLNITTKQVLITHGARFALYLAITTNISPGGSALFFEPAYPAFRQIVESVEGRPVAISTRLENGWTPDVKTVEDLFDDPPDIMILNSPSNPTGKNLSINVINQLIKFATEKGVIVISDEVYKDYVFNQYKSILEYNKCRSIFISSFSKSHSMTGYRIGYAIGSKEDISRMASLGNLALTCLPEFVQRSAIMALECQDIVEKNVDTIHSRAMYLCDLLDDLPVEYYPPDGGFYVFPRFNRSGFNSETFALNLLRKNHVSVAPGTAFGDFPNFLRISLCQPKEKIADAVRRMENALR
jgi:aspartate aminotransferase|tara:strand:+ start:3140 stop:4549 length:1410 start_codon:yes stop_codon:yes gene_type:complete